MAEPRRCTDRCFFCDTQCLLKTPHQGKQHAFHCTC